MSGFFKTNRFVLYKNGTVLCPQQESKNTFDDYFQKFKKLNQIGLQQISVFEDFIGYAGYDGDSPSITLLHIVEQGKSFSNSHQNQIKKDMLANFEKDYKSKEIIFDSKGKKLSDFEPVMYIFVNNSLSMDKGKLCSQVGHVVGKTVERLVKKSTQEYIDWSQCHCKKIVLKATEQQIAELTSFDGAISIHDAGRTQVAPNSLTVVGFPPRYMCNVPKNFYNKDMYKLL